MTRGRALVLGLCLLGCEVQPQTPSEGSEASLEASAADLSTGVDPTLLRELLGESVRVEGELVFADSLVIRLAFEPLIRGTGPVSLQQVQGQGYRLTGIGESSPLWLLGLRDGDVLTAVDDAPILGREQELRGIYETRPPLAKLSFQRGTETHTLRLQISRGPGWGLRPDPIQPLRTRERPPLDERIGSSSAANPELMIEFAAGLRCTADDSLARIGRCELERKVVDKLIAAPESFARSARIVPSQRDGEPVGFKLYGIRPKSIPYQLGVKNGDLLASINGHSLTSVEAALSAYESLRGQSKFELEFERKGKAMVLELEVVDALSGPPTTMRDEIRSVSPDLRDPFGDR